MASSPTTEANPTIPPVAAAETAATTAGAEAQPASAVAKWPGWPGDNVYRLIVPVAKVGGIIGKKGELVKKMCEDTHARIRVLEGHAGTNDRIVLVSGKEESDSPLPPAMDAAIRIFKRVAGLSTTEGDETAAAGSFCSIRLLMATSQAVNLIGKQGTTIKSIQESSSATVRILPEGELPSYATSDERIVEIQGDSSAVVKGLEAILGHLRKFLVDHSVLPVFEKNYAATISQDRTVDSWADKSQSLLQPAPQTGFNIDLPGKRDPFSFHFDHEPQLETKIQHSGMPPYGKDPGLGSGLRSTGFDRPAAPIVTQITQTMQVPLSYAEDIIGIGGSNIAYIRRSSGAILTVQESRGLPDEITVEIKGTSSQVQTAQQLIQEFISNHKEPVGGSIYGKMDSGLNSSYSHLTDTNYSSSSYPSQSLGGYGGGAGAYNRFRY